MPTYEYKCVECGHVFEEVQSIKAESLRTCPQCGKDGLKRVLGGGGGMIFKGKGFYLTDYKKSGGEAKKSEKPASGDGSASPGTPKTDSPKKDSPPPPPPPSPDKKS